ncbi:hypothetical protein J22TS1_45280 [Siminovitchia terrae]|uniref:DUF2207 domain-containing protein n=1 Tax=Siminovitchia terrae TaxID=1914933 RepID=UPI001AFF1760|nr:DUF2207 domain-containing protein [Siminovitchia terrae]GIN93477.1 hypothetical protein J22TS1_45280 [Siminovitchia terrae]
MLKKYILPTLILLFFIPSSVYAVDFSIPDVKIDAYLQEDGDVNVNERHTYTFDGKFNGITREIFPKKGAEIRDLMAKEKEKSLKVEKEEELYKIHRSGKDETIHVDIHYIIKNGMDKYNDVTEFYWPFFDDRNEADYGKMTIAIHPPQPTDDAIALGYESAFKTENVADDGTVVFSMGEVEAGENGDVRVAYDSTLFPAMSLTANREMKEEIVSEKRTMEENAIIYAKNKRKTASTAIWVLVGFTAFFVVIAMNEFNRSKRKRKAAIDAVFNQRLKIPEQQMSMPATIFFTDEFHNSTIAAGLMDLVRQGYVKQTKEGYFQLISREAAEEHERILISFLFDKIGWNGEFCMDNLEEFMENKKNHMKYINEINRWKAAVTNETKQASLYDQRKTVRIAAGLLSLFPFWFIILSAKYDLFLYMTLFILLFIVYLGFSIFYKSLAVKGMRMQEEWRRLVNEFDRISDWNWKLYNEDDRMRAMIYSLGIEGAISAKMNRVLDESASSSSFYPMNWLVLTSSFDMAGEQAKDTVASQSSGSSSSVGGGVGGGGGGSGAF